MLCWGGKKNNEVITLNRSFPCVHSVSYLLISTKIGRANSVWQERINHAVPHASAALCPRFQLQECITNVDKSGRMNTAWIPNPQVVREAGSWEKTFIAVTQADVILKPFRDKQRTLQCLLLDQLFKARLDFFKVQYLSDEMIACARVYAKEHLVVGNILKPPTYGFCENGVAFKMGTRPISQLTFVGHVTYVSLCLASIQNYLPVRLLMCVTMLIALLLGSAAVNKRQMLSA